MRALSIRQPYAELILRGTKTIEYRSRPTRIVGERFYLYATKRWATTTNKAWSLDLAMPTDGPPPWMTELAEGLRLLPRDLPTGVLVGTATIARVTARADGMYAWHLADVERIAKYRTPRGHPQPVWFEPFG